MFLAGNRHLRALDGSVRLIGDGSLKPRAGCCLGERVTAPQTKKQKPNQKYLHKLSHFSIPPDAAKLQSLSPYADLPNELIPIFASLIELENRASRKRH